MNYQEFLQTIKEQVEEKLPITYTVMIEQLEKNNGLILDGLIIVNPDLNISPNIYLNPYYHQFLDGISIDDIVDEIISVYHNVVPSQNVDLDVITNFSKAKDKLTYKLVNYEKNKNRLKDIPHYKYLDMAIIFCCIYTHDNESYSSMLIHHHHLNMWNITKEKIYSIAIENTPKLLPVYVDNIIEIIKDFVNVEDLTDDINMYVISNKMKLHGASAILYNNTLRDLSNKLNTDLILLPSSVHEFICLPYTQDINLFNYSAIVKEINCEHVADEEVLSDNVYIYSREKDKLDFFVA